MDFTILVWVLLGFTLLLAFLALTGLAMILRVVEDHLKRRDAVEAFRVEAEFDLNGIELTDRQYITVKRLQMVD